MKSHDYEFSLMDLAKIVGGPSLTVVFFALGMHLGAIFNVLPPPRPALDMDRTILLHQAEASRSKQSANLILIGDSSCLMDVSAERLTRLVGHRTLNLGTLSYLDLPSFALMLSHFFSANPSQARTVVFLLHPEFLRRHEPVEHHVETLRKFYAGRDHCDSTGIHERLSCVLGLEIFKGRILSRVLPVPLPKEFARKYGFTTDLWRYLSRHHGSAIDPGKFAAQTGQGNAEFRVSKRLESDSRQFKALLPAGVRLVVGLTPVPSSFVAPNYAKTYQQMLQEWSRWIQADRVLTNLPATLPDHLFASTTHLTEAGTQRYTDILARSLEPSLP